MISFGAVLYDFRYCMTSLLYCLAWCCRWSRELCLSRSCMISFGAVLYDFVTVLLGLVL